MNRLNPLYIIALVVVVYVVSLIQVNEIENKFLQKYHQSEVLLSHIEDVVFYRQNWFNKKATLEKIEKLLNCPNLRKEKILKVNKGNKLLLTIESKNSKKLGLFLKKLLNEKFILNKVQLRQNSMFVEIGI